MKRRWELRPNLDECILEERIVPAIANLGSIILTTSGFALVTPFPGASSSFSASGAGGSNASSVGAGGSVSGAAIPSSFYITGNRGISTFTPGNFTGNPAVAGGAAGASSGVSLTIQVGSGADTPSAPVAAAPAARLNFAYGGANSPILAYIGQPATGSGSPVLPPGASYRAPAAPVPPLPPVIMGAPPAQGSPTTLASPLNPQSGAPSSWPGPGGRSTNPLPGGLGVGMGSLVSDPLR